MDSHAVLAVVLVSLAFVQVLWVDHILWATKALLYATVSIMLAATAFFLGMAAIYIRVCAPDNHRGGRARLERLVLAAGAAAAMASLAARFAACSRC
ncbi:hypothetical protein ACP70R_044803 [Stipagrostis hirtigluma subsp. patula]